MESPPTALKPYLELPHLLSLIWLAPPVISLLFVLFRIQIAATHAQDSLLSAKQGLVASCKAAELSSGSTASMPRYLAMGTNQAFIQSVNSTLNGARETLIIVLTIAEAVLNFLVDIYRSTFLCFIQLIIRGILAILISAVQEISTAVNAALSGISTAIGSDLSSSTSAVQSVVKTINSANPLHNINAPAVDTSTLSSLQNVTIPTDFENGLIQLNNSMPTISDIQKALNVVMDTPFEMVKKLINDTFLALSFNESMMTVPDQNSLAFCGNMDTSIVDNLGLDILKIVKLGTFLIIGSICLLMMATALLEWHKWRCLKTHLENTRQAWITDPTVGHPATVRDAPPVENPFDDLSPTVDMTSPTHIRNVPHLPTQNAPMPAQNVPTLVMTDYNLMKIGALSAHPLFMQIANKIAQWFHLSPSQHNQLQWFFHYIFQPPALACFIIGTTGLASVQLQLLAVSPLSAKYASAAAGAVSDFSNLIFHAVNDSMYNQSAAYANQVNGHVSTIQSTIDDGLFSWVNATTSTLNTTLVNIYTEIQTYVNLIFGQTPLQAPMQEFVKCLIGSKVNAMEQAITFLHDNLQVQLPTMNKSALVLSQATIYEAVQPVAQAAIGSGAAGNGGFIGRIVNAYVSALQKERVMFAIFVGIWGLVVLIAIALIIRQSYRVKSNQGPQVRTDEEQRVSIDEEGTIVNTEDQRSMYGEKAQMYEDHQISTYGEKLSDNPFTTYGEEKLSDNPFTTNEQETASARARMILARRLTPYWHHEQAGIF